ncbi:hypothetical protein ACIQPR_45250 [Streptomyces sp. NPDC091280]|uniref:hypothetical protein n=1 Tax=Streptomyces sp. NPDC091280 TaxID=3365984 RepID=UPI0037FC6F0B
MAILSHTVGDHCPLCAAVHVVELRRPAAAIAARARMALGAYRAVPGHEAAHELDC